MTKHEQLLADALGEHQGNEFARQAAAHVRRRRALRQLGAGVGVACMVAAMFFLSRPLPTVPAGETVMAPPKPAMEIMTDQELLAQLKDQPVLILKDDNRITGVVFLESGAKL